MKPSKKSIETFLEPKKLAIAGVSRNEKKFGYQVYKDLKDKGFEIYPVNPNTESIDGLKCYQSVKDIPEGVDNLLVLTSKAETINVLKDAQEKGIKEVWIQQMSETPEVSKFASDKFNVVIMKQCIMMHASPVTSIHKFHRGIMKFFRLLPN